MTTANATPTISHAGPWRVRIPIAQPTAPSRTMAPSTRTTDLRRLDAICSYTCQGWARSTRTGPRAGSSMSKNSRGLNPKRFATTFDGKDWIRVFNSITWSL
jgi:hypothetical protein